MKLSLELITVIHLAPFYSKPQHSQPRQWHTSVLSFFLFQYMWRCVLKIIWY